MVGLIIGNWAVKFVVVRASLMELFDLVPPSTCDRSCVQEGTALTESDWQRYVEVKVQGE